MEQKTENVKPVRLTKKGLPDKRAESSKKNLEKGKSIIKEALKQVKNISEKKPNTSEVIYSSDEYSTDEEEILLTETKVSEKPINKLELSNDIVIPELERKDTKNISEKVSNDNKVSSENYIFSFEKKLEEKIKELNDMYGIKISTIENETKMTKAELNTLKLQNQALKKTMTNNFRTHAGIINEEMYLKF